MREEELSGEFITVVAFSVWMCVTSSDLDWYFDRREGAFVLALTFFALLQLF